jgi:hypothetical protein
MTPTLYLGHEGVAFTPSNENSRFGYFRGNVTFAYH